MESHTASLYVHRVYQNDGNPTFLAGVQGKRVLDVGCGAGGNAKVLRSQGCRVWGVTLSELEAELSASFFERVYYADIQNWTPEVSQEFYEVLLFSHILEHLSDPSAVIQRLLPYLTSNGQIYIALPNVVYWKVRLKILFGKFDYTDDGILDRTHLKFFTPTTAEALVRSSGCRVISSRVDGHIPFGPIRKIFPGICKKLDQLACKYFPSVFGFIIEIIAQKA